MKLTERFFLLIFSLIFIAIAVVTLLVGVEFFSLDYIENIIGQIYSDTDVKIAVIIISIVVIILGLYLLFSSLRSKKDNPFSTKINETGNIRISMETIENIVLNVSGKIRGVKEQKVRVRIEENETVTIILKIIVDGVVSIPVLSEEVQNSVKDTVEEIVGVTVNQVHVIVANINKLNTKKSRVE